MPGHVLLFADDVVLVGVLTREVVVGFDIPLLLGDMLGPFFAQVGTHLIDGYLAVAIAVDAAKTCCIGVQELLFGDRSVVVQVFGFETFIGVGFPRINIFGMGLHRKDHADGRQWQ